MAIKNIGARIVLEGADEYQRNIKSINATQKELQSELKLTTSEFAGQENSLQALEAKQDIYVKQLNAQTEKLAEYQRMLDANNKAHEEYGEKVEGLSSELVKAKDAYKDMQASGSATKEELKAQEQIVKELEASLKTAEDGYYKTGEATKEWQTKLNNGNAELNNLEKNLEKNNKYLEEARSSTDGCAKSIDEFGKEVKEADENSKDFGKDTKAAFDALSQALIGAGLVKGVQEISDALMECVESADRFATSVAKVTTVADMSVTTYTDLSKLILQTSNEIGVMSGDIAEATYQALSAGIETGKAVQFAGEASKLAVAGFTDSATAVDIMTTALNAYGLSAEESIQVSNQLLITQNLGKTTVEELASSLGKVIPTAAASSVDFANLATSMSIMTANGIKTKIAVTDLNALLNELSSNSSDVAAILRENTGKSFEELMASGKSLGDVIGILNGISEKSGVSLKNMFSNSTAGTAALSIMSSGVEKFNRVLNEMETNTTATSKAFETMSSTSEYSTKRMSVAVENLKITIGDELSPALTKATDGVTNIVEAMTEFVDRNEWLVDVVAALISSLSVVVAGIGGYIAVTKTAQLATAAFNAVLEANPIGLIVIALAGLTAGVATFVATLNGAETETEKLVNDVSKLNKTIDEEQEKRASATESMSAQAVVSRSLVAEIQTLNAIENKSADDNKKLEVAVSKLNQLYPELGVAIDKNTGKLNMSTEALKANSEAMQEQARVVAYQEALEQSTSELIEVELQLEEITQQLTESTGMQAGELDTLLELYAEGGIVTSGVADSYKALKDQQAELNEEISIYTDKISGTSSTMEQASAEAEKLATSYYALGDKVVEVTGLTSAQRDRITELQLAYNDAYDSAKSSIEGQVSLMNAIEVEEAQSLESLTKNAQKNAEVLHNYYSDLYIVQEAAAKGLIDSGLVDELKKLGIEGGAGYVKELSDQFTLSSGTVGYATEESSKKVRDLQTAYADLSGAISQTADVMVSDQEKAYKEALGLTDEHLTAIEETTARTVETIKSTINGSNISAEFETQMSEAVEAVNSALGMEDGVSSVFVDIGEAIPASMCVGIDNARQSLIDKMDSVIDSMISRIEARKGDIANAVDKALGDATS